MPMDSCSSKFSLWISMSLILVIISVAYFSHEAPGFVSKSDLLNFLEILYPLFIGILLLYGLTGWRGCGRNNVEMGMSLGFRASMSEILRVDFESGSYAECGIGGNVVVMDLSDEWLGLPVRSLKYVVDERRGVKSGDGGFCAEVGGNRLFGELSPVNLLEKFNEAAVLLRANVAS